MIYWNAASAPAPGSPANICVIARPNDTLSVTAVISDISASAGVDLTSIRVGLLCVVIVELVKSILAAANK